MEAAENLVRSARSISVVIATRTDGRPIGIIQTRLFSGHDCVLVQMLSGQLIYSAQRLEAGKSFDL
jgi:hypothetical protein